MAGTVGVAPPWQPGGPPVAPFEGSQPYPGIPFHRTLTRLKGNWWRFLVAVVLGLLGLVILQVVFVLGVWGIARLVGFSHYTIPLDGHIDPGILLATNLSLAALIPLAGLIVFVLYGVRLRWLSSFEPRLRWRWLLTAFAVAGVVWLPLFLLLLFGALLTRKDPLNASGWWMLLIVLLTQPLQAAGEEYLFRGLLLQAAGATRMPSWIAIVVSAGLFATAHLQFAPPLFADRFLLGVVLAWLAIRTGGLESGIAIHAVSNISAFIPAILLGQVDDTLDPTSVTWIPVVVAIVLLAIVTPLLVWLLKRRQRDGRLRTQSNEPPSNVPSAMAGYAAVPGWTGTTGGYPALWGWQQPPPAYPPPGYPPVYPPSGYPPSGYPPAYPPSGYPPAYPPSGYPPPVYPPTRQGPPPGAPRPPGPGYQYPPRGPASGYPAPGYHPTSQVPRSGPQQPGSPPQPQRPPDPAATGAPATYPAGSGQPAPVPPARVQQPSGSDGGSTGRTPPWPPAPPQSSSTDPSADRSAADEATRLNGEG